MAKKQKWIYLDGENRYEVIMSVPAFSFGRIKLKINGRKYTLRPQKKFSFSVKRNEALMLGENRGMLQVISKRKARLLVNGEEIPRYKKKKANKPDKV